jgi:DNA polymerase-1
MAAVSGDVVLRDALASGDVYTADAIEIFGLPKDSTKKSIKPQARKAAKIGHLGFQYGAGDAALFKQFLMQDRTISFRQVVGIRKGLMKRYARTVEYWTEEHARVMACGYSASRIMDRRRTYPREPPPTETSNYPIQGTASDIANLAMIELHGKLRQYVPGARIITQLHDAFDVECLVSEVSTVEGIMQEVMEKPILVCGELRTFPVEIKVGEKWSDV